MVVPNLMGQAFKKGAFGMSGSTLAVVLPTLSQLEQWFRVAGAAVGLAVGVVTLISMIRNLRAAKK